MRSTFAITSVVASVFAVGMCAAWAALPRDATKVPPPSATPPQPQTQTASERR